MKLKKSLEKLGFKYNSDKQESMYKLYDNFSICITFCDVCKSIGSIK